jgi:cell division septum initiation protein DivIVA
MRQLAKLGNENLGQFTLAIRRALENRLFAAQADADNLAEAARAEIKAAAALDNTLEFNRAAVRGADLMLMLAERAREARVARLQGIEQAMSAVARLKTPKLFWVLPRAPIAETP